MSITKQCPFCCEEIISTAKKCKHCGEWFISKDEALNSINTAGTDVAQDATVSERPQHNDTAILTAFATQYEIIYESGRGGMATVYKARQLSLDRIVALKVVPREYCHDLDFIKRFKKEAQNSAKLSHPNIITIHEVGELGGYPFIAMEYLEGGSLSELIHKQGKLPEEQIMDIIIPILEGLEYAHYMGIIHRDIKSGNIMFDRHKRPVLMDFGIARSTEGTKLTQTGTVMGTQGYMSPEQAKGLEVDHRSDLYSIGIVMYEMATGKVPFQADSIIGFIHKVVNEYIIPVKEVNPSISGYYSLVIDMLLEKNPEDRYSSASEVIEGLTYTGVQKDEPNIQNNETADVEIIDIPNREEPDSGIIIAISLIVIMLVVVLFTYVFKV